MQSLQTEPSLLRKEVGNLKKDTTTLTNNSQSAEVLLNTVQTGTKLLKEEVIHPQEKTNTLNTNEVLLEVVQTNNKLFKKEIAH